MPLWLNSIKNKFFKKPVPSENYLALEFESSQLLASVWELSGNKAQVIGVSSQAILGIDIKDEGIKAANLAISALEDKTKKIDKVIFGVPTEWSENGSIKGEYLSFLKTLSSQLALVPKGFVVNEEALAFYLGHGEGVPTTAILINVGDCDVVVSVSKIGKIRQVTRKKIDSNLCETVAVALSEFCETEVLPSRILVYGAKDNLEEVRQQLISFPWMTKIEFLHFPKVDVLDRAVSINSVSFAGASEIVKNDKLQFVKGEFNSELNPLPILQDSAPLKNEDPIESEDLGFVEDEDILEKEKEKEETEVMDSGFELETPPVLPVVPTAKFTMPKVSLSFGFLKNIHLPKIRVKKPDTSGFGSSAKILPIILAVLILFIFGGVVLYWNSVKAQVVLIAQPKTIEKNADILVSSEQSLMDETKKIIPGIWLEATESGSQSTDSTGKKTTGEKAKGEVIIYNKTSSAKLFPEGTVIFSGDGLKFITDQQASVSAQTETDGGTTYGKQKVNVTASSFGTKYNLPSGTKFKVGDFAAASYEAKNESTLSGGSSRDVTVISKEDQDKLLKGLSATLLIKAKTDLLSQQNDKQKVIDGSIDSTINKKQFSKKTDEESKDLSLDLSMEFKGLSYNDQDLKSLMERLSSADLPSGYTYVSQNAQNRVEVKEVKKDGTVVLKVKFTAKLLPKINVADVQNSLKGKSYNSGVLYLKTLPNINSTEVTIKPKLPGFLYAFPRVLQNISVEIRSK